MTIRAVIWDVYSTLLEVGPPPSDAEAQWRRLFEKTFGATPTATRLEFFAACSQVIAKRHDWAKSRGIAKPEIQWPSVVIELLPELSRCSAPVREEFIYQHIQTGRRLALSNDAVTALAWLRQAGIPLGIASNSQAYTLREMAQELAPRGLDLSLFAPDLCFWSFQHGFSKPDPHVFQHLTARLEARGVDPAATLMVGDRLDNDIAPARAFGWQTWHLSVSPTETPGGSWDDLLALLKNHAAAP